MPTPIKDDIILLSFLRANEKEINDSFENGEGGSFYRKNNLLGRSFTLHQEQFINRADQSSFKLINTKQHKKKSGEWEKT
jgi:hypothetical protein